MTTTGATPSTPSTGTTGSTTWRNWAGTELARPTRLVTPSGVAQVAAAVRSAAADGLTVKAIGSGHSFTGAAVTSGVMIRPDHLGRLLSVDRESGLVEVEAGMPLHRLNPLLAQ